MGARSFRAMFIVVGAASLALRAVVPPNTLFGSTHDDELMVRLAASILRGEWLGDYADLGHLTLAKPAGFPLFLALTHGMPWAPTVTVHLLLLLGAGILLAELRRFGATRQLVLLLFVLISFFPPWFGDQMSRIYREGLLSALMMLALGLALALRRHLAMEVPRVARRRREELVMALVALVLGVALSFAVATKPSWYALALVAVAIPASAVLDWRRDRLRHRLRPAAVVCVAMLLGAASVPGYIVVQNKRHYDVAVLDTFAYSSFPEALNLWSSVESESPRRYVFIDQTQRAAVYGVSPTAAALKPYLEFSTGVGWRGSACSSALQICDESSAWFVWELRDAVQQAGLGDTAVEFERTMRQLIREIDRGCDDGSLSCGRSGLAPGVGPLSSIPKRDIVDGASSALAIVLEPTVGQITRGPYTITDEQYALWSSTIRGLPDTDAPAVYRPEARNLGNTVHLLLDVYRVIWIPLLLTACAGLLLRNPLGNARRGRALRVVGGIVLVALLVMIGQLALLEASSGLYVTLGGELYLLPAFPLLLAFVSIGTTRLAAVLPARGPFSPSADETFEADEEPEDVGAEGAVDALEEEIDTQAELPVDRAAPSSHLGDDGGEDRVGDGDPTGEQDSARSS